MYNNVVQRMEKEKDLLTPHVKLLWKIWAVQEKLKRLDPPLLQYILECGMKGAKLCFACCRGVVIVAHFARLFSLNLRV